MSATTVSSDNANIMHNEKNTNNRENEIITNPNDVIRAVGANSNPELLDNESTNEEKVISQNNNNNNINNNEKNNNGSTIISGLNRAANVFKSLISPNRDNSKIATPSAPSVTKTHNKRGPKPKNRDNNVPVSSSTSAPNLLNSDIDDSNNMDIGCDDYSTDESSSTFCSTNGTGELNHTRFSSRLNSGNNNNTNNNKNNKGNKNKSSSTLPVDTPVYPKSSSRLNKRSVPTSLELEDSRQSKLSKGNYEETLRELSQNIENLLSSDQSTRSAILDLTAESGWNREARMKVKKHETDMARLLNNYASLNSNLENLSGKVTLLESRSNIDGDRTLVDNINELRSRLEALEASNLVSGSAINRDIQQRDIENTPSLNPNLICGVILKENTEKEIKSRNVIMYGLVNTDNTNPSTSTSAGSSSDLSMVQNVLNFLKININAIKSVSRLPSTDPTRTPPVVVRLMNADTRNQILVNSKHLRNSNNFTNVFIKPDLKRAEREYEKNLINDKNNRNKKAEEDGIPTRWAVRDLKLVKFDNNNNNNNNPSGSNQVRSRSAVAYNQDSYNYDNNQHADRQGRSVPRNNQVPSYLRSDTRQFSYRGRSGSRGSHSNYIRSSIYNQNQYNNRPQYHRGPYRENQSNYLSQNNTHQNTQGFKPSTMNIPDLMSINTSRLNELNEDQQQIGRAPQRSIHQSIGSHQQSVIQQQQPYQQQPFVTQHQSSAIQHQSPAIQHQSSAIQQHSPTIQQQFHGSQQPQQQQHQQHQQQIATQQVSPVVQQLQVASLPQLTNVQPLPIIQSQIPVIQQQQIPIQQQQPPMQQQIPIQQQHQPMQQQITIQQQHPSMQQQLPVLQQQQQHQVAHPQHQPACCQTNGGIQQYNMQYQHHLEHVNTGFAGQYTSNHFTNSQH